MTTSRTNERITGQDLDSIRASLCELGELGERGKFIVSGYKMIETPRRVSETFTLVWGQSSAIVTIDFAKELV